MQKVKYDIIKNKSKAEMKSIEDTFFKRLPGKTNQFTKP